jgi:hypothetical protein
MLPRPELSPRADVREAGWWWRRRRKRRGRRGEGGGGGVGYVVFRAIGRFPQPQSPSQHQVVRFHNCLNNDDMSAPDGTVRMFTREDRRSRSVAMGDVSSSIAVFSRNMVLVRRRCSMTRVSISSCKTNRSRQRYGCVGRRVSWERWAGVAKGSTSSLRPAGTGARVVMVACARPNPCACGDLMYASC